ncbi:GTPase [Actinomadura parmotrematis]|uniref:50S ribosome-binding GTPase n=1 Tax=Actinomadura parmotrematis TaxID=2864039 RepID=A0ABS7FP85_9ACTN|nr:GTPase [Actinomadura parmotrematis]MBW8482208.1 50S ribosome-binding GTPase [Actinomadura parmotrematis]
MDDDEIRARIRTAMEARAAVRGEMQALTEGWDGLVQDFGALITAAESGLAGGTALGETVRDALTAFLGTGDGTAGALHERLRRMADPLGALAARLARDSLHIGVMGVTKAGKSTLLRTIAGLEDRDPEVIPVAKGLTSTTAVRNRIINSDDERALLLQRGFEEFREVFLAPHHEYLGLDVPQTLEGYRGYRYPPGKTGGADSRSPDEWELLKRLRGVHRSLPHYEKDLREGARPGTPSREIGLAEVAAYVSYPGKGEPHRYPGLREVWIHCPFPAFPVPDVVLVDFPGTQEQGVDVGSQFLRGQANEVDVMLHVKTPEYQQSHDAGTDTQNRRLIEDVAAGVRLGDFMMMVFNDRRDRPVLNDAEYTEAMRLSREVLDGYGVRIVRTDLIDRDQVHRSVLDPLLAHLAADLADMDRQAVRAVRERDGADRLARQAAEAAVRLLEALPGAGDGEQQSRIYGEAAVLIGELRRGIAEVRDRYLQMVLDRRGSEEIDAASKAAAERIRAWLADDFEGDQRRHIENLSLAHPGYPAGDVLTHARFFVADEYQKRIDASMEAAIKGLQQGIEDTLWERLPDEALPDERGLAPLAAALRAGGRPNLAGVVAGLAELGDRYGRRNLFLRVVEPVVSLHLGGYEQDGAGGRKAAPSAGADADDVDDDIDAPAWRTRPAESSASEPAGADDGVGEPHGGRSRGAAGRLRPAVETAETDTETLISTLRAVVAATLDRLEEALERESEIAVEALFAGGDHFFNGFVNGAVAYSELTGLFTSALAERPPDERARRGADLLAEIARRAAGVRDGTAEIARRWPGPEPEPQPG